MAEDKKKMLDPEPVTEEKETAGEKTAKNEEMTKAAVEDTAEAAEDTEERDDALESFLNREQEEKKPKKNASSRKRALVAVIVAALAVAILVAALIFLRGRPPVHNDDEYTPAELTLSVSDDGVHEAVVTVDEDGSIKQNGSGTLISNYPADIKRIDVENEDGSFSVTSETPSGEATVYTLVGFESFALQDGIADEIASSSASLEFSRVISVDADLADFGLDKPRATVNVTYQDDTTAVFRVGNNAAGEDTGTYVSFGTSDTVFLADTASIKPFLYSVNEFISRDITDAMEDSDNADFTKLTLTGTHFDEPIVIEPNTDEAIEASYVVTSPKTMFANAVESSDIAGDIRGLYAEAVVCANPSKDQLASYGLSEPYATAEASYPDTDITLHTSAPGDDGTVYIYNPDKNAVYTIQLAAVCWAKTNMDLLMPENPLQIRMRCVSGLSFSAGDVKFTAALETTSETVTDDDGNEQEAFNTTATCDGKELDSDNFSVFFQNLNAIKNRGSAEKSGDKVMSVTYSYSTGRSDDTLDVYVGDEGDYALELNGDPIGSASRTYIDNLIAGADSLIKGESVPGL